MSGWVVERIQIAYVNVARYQPLRGGTYLPLPANLAKKKAIINVKNRDNECLKWALRAALFPPKDGKDPQRPSKYPVNDGINYGGIDFPTPVKQIEKLEAQNANLAINVFGWEDNCVIVHQISKKEAKVPRINLMLIESGEIQHYCYVKRESALLFYQSKNKRKTLLYAVLNPFLKSRLARESQKILQWCERQADKDRDARGGEKHPFLPKLQKADENALCNICGLRGFNQEDSRL